MTNAEIIRTVGARIALDLRQQVGRDAREAAAEAGCRTEDEVALWIERFRAAAARPEAVSSARSA